MKKLILIDGNAIFHRAYHSLPPFKTSKGETTNAIFGFLRMLLDLYINQQPDYLGIAWDRKAPTLRKQKYDAYKATRSAPPEDLYPQLPRLKEVITAFQIPQLEKDGYEADDLLGTAAQKAADFAAQLEAQGQKLEVIILTGDQDSFQLVRGPIKVMYPIKGVSTVKMYGAEQVIEKFGVRPDQIIDYKALSGDSSDNIPGVPGIGPKNATQLLQKYETLNNIYAHLDELTPNQQKKLTEGRESAYLSQELATIHLDAPLDFDIETYETHDINYNDVQQLFSQLEFNSLSRRLEQLKDVVKPAGQVSLF